MCCLTVVFPLVTHRLSRKSSPCSTSPPANCESLVKCVTFQPCCSFGMLAQAQVLSAGSIILNKLGHSHLLHVQIFSTLDCVRPGPRTFCWIGCKFNFLFLSIHLQNIDPVYDISITQLITRNSKCNLFVPGCSCFHPNNYMRHMGLLSLDHGVFLESHLPLMTLIDCAVLSFAPAVT